MCIYGAIVLGLLALSLAWLAWELSQAKEAPHED